MLLVLLPLLNGGLLRLQVRQGSKALQALLLQVAVRHGVPHQHHPLVQLAEHIGDVLGALQVDQAGQQEPQSSINTRLQMQQVHAQQLRAMLPDDAIARAARSTHACQIGAVITCDFPQPVRTAVTAMMGLAERSMVCSGVGTTKSAPAICTRAPSCITSV